MGVPECSTRSTTILARPRPPEPAPVRHRGRYTSSGWRSWLGESCTCHGRRLPAWARAQTSTASTASTAWAGQDDAVNGNGWCGCDWCQNIRVIREQAATAAPTITTATTASTCLSGIRTRPPSSPLTRTSVVLRTASARRAELGPLRPHSGYDTACPTLSSRGDPISSYRWHGCFYASEWTTATHIRRCVCRQGRHADSQESCHPSADTDTIRGHTGRETWGSMA